MCRSARSYTSIDTANDRVVRQVSNHHARRTDSGEEARSAVSECSRHAKDEESHHKIQAARNLPSRETDGTAKSDAALLPL